MELNGGCLCRAIRYRVQTLDGDVADYCHCGKCRKASGAPVTAWIQVPPSRFHITQGQAAGFASSDHSTRWFCAACGSPLYMTDNANRSVGVTLGTLDDAGAVRPTVHGWTSKRLAWLQIADDLPRHAESPPYDL